MNKFRIINIHGIKLIFGPGWFYKGSIEKFRCICFPDLIYCWNALFQNNCVEYIEDDEEQVDIETVEDLSEEINVAHMKTTAAQTQTFKQP